MQPFDRHRGLVAPLPRANVDTDAIIPKQFLKSIARSGFGPYLFDEWRYLDHGEPGVDCTHRPRRPEFVLNRPGYAGATILVAGRNFGCGSSREHAVWALADYGFRVVVAPSYGEIFYNNTVNSGLLAIRLDEAVVDGLLARAAAQEGYALDVDLDAQTVTEPDGAVHCFEIDAHRKHRLLHGLDDIGLTLGHAAAIRDYEARRAAQAPWLFPDRPAP
jgi:3-isopropylmalate/(R)-2-methylmalate dehydratase small subunit